MAAQRPTGDERDSIDALSDAAPAAASSTADTHVGAKTEPSPVEMIHEERIRQLEAALEGAQQQNQEEIHSYLERIDALQAKLQYLAREATDAARKAAQEAPAGSMEKKLAERDQQIAGLMEEGKNLGKTEQTHRALIKKLRAKMAEDERELSDVRTSKGRLEAEMETLRRRARQADELERAQDASQKRIAQLQRDVSSLGSDSTSKDGVIADLTSQLQKANQQAESAAAKAAEEALARERQRTRDLEDQVAALEVEKSLVADRGRAQANDLREKAERAAERARAVELEMKAEVQAAESKLEALRVRAEEASSGAAGDSQAKLLRQVETLQSQYSVASENWQGIETTLLARVAGLEKERDEALQRESEMRKKAREAVRTPHQLFYFFLFFCSFRF